MKKWLLILLMIPMFAKAEVPHRNLSPEDHDIYVKTFNKCHDGTVGAAFKATINPEIIKSAATNLAQIMMLNPQASKQRADSNFVSPELYRITNSDGFWLAFNDCYAGSSEARVILIKNIIDLGHFTSELTGTLGGVYAFSKVAAFNGYMLKAHPLLTRLLMIAGVSVTLNQTYQAIRNEYFKDPTPQEAAMIRAIEADMFKDVNSTIRQIIVLADLKIKNIDEKLRDPRTSSEERQALLKQRQDLIQQVQSLQSGKANAR